MPECNSAAHIRRLQAERIDCINMAASCRTSFKNTLLLFRRADELENEISEEVNENVMPVRLHNAADVP